MTHRNDAVPVRPRRARNPKNTREQLVRAALELFTTVGYHASTTPLLARKAGVAEGTIYRHFESKGQLLNEIYRAAVRLLVAGVPDAGDGLSCRGRLDRIAANWRDIASANPPLIKLVFVLDLQGLLDVRSVNAYEAMLESIEAVMVDGKSAGHVRAGAARIWADVWLRLVVLVLERTAAGEWPPDHSAPRQVFACAWDAIAAPTPLAS